MIKFLKMLFVNKVVGYILLSIPVVSVYTVMGLKMGFINAAVIIAIWMLALGCIWIGLDLIYEKYK